MRLRALDQRAGKGETFGAILAGNGLLVRKKSLIMNLAVLDQRVGKSDTVRNIKLQRDYLCLTCVSVRNIKQ